MRPASTKKTVQEYPSIPKLISRTQEISEIPVSENVIWSRWISPVTREFHLRMDVH